jgi:hypothetical protein
VEYILEKALPVFPRLKSLEVTDVVQFYDSLQKISMRYLLPLMPFDSICLAFGFKGLCPPGLGTIQYAAIGLVWMDVLPRILPKEDLDVELVKFLVGYESNNGFDLMWHVWNWQFQDLNPLIQSKFHRGPRLRTFFLSAEYTSFTFVFSQNIICSLVPVCRPTFFYATFNSPNMPMSSQLFSLTSMPTSMRMITAICQQTCVSMALLR